MSNLSLIDHDIKNIKLTKMCPLFFVISSKHLPMITKELPTKAMLPITQIMIL